MSEIKLFHIASGAVTRNVFNVGHFGNGDLEITFSKAEDLERAEPLIEISYGAS